MTKLMFNDEACIMEVSRWVGVVYDKLSSEAGRLRVRQHFTEQLKLGTMPMREVVAAAKAGSVEADQAIRDYIKEIMDGDNPQLTTTIKHFIQEMADNKPVSGPEGRHSMDNWRRDVGIAVLVFLTMQTFHMNKGKSATVTAAALGRHRINMTPKRVRDIYRDRGLIAGKLTAAVPQLA